MNHSQTSPIKNLSLAITMILFLALSFKMAGEISSTDNANAQTETQTTVLSPTDDVVNTFNNQKNP